MNRIICVKGHFYDGDKYRECPHCAAGMGTVGQESGAVWRGAAGEGARTDGGSAERTDGRRTEPERQGAGKTGRGIGAFFSRRQKSAETEPSERNAAGQSGAYVDMADRKGIAGEERTYLMTDDGPTGPWTPPPLRESAPCVTGPASAPRELREDAPCVTGPASAPRELREDAPCAAGPASASRELRESAPRVTGPAYAAPVRQDDDEGVTVGFFSSGRTEPPVGYLICTDGPDYGRGFSLKSGSNSIGRSALMDVAVLDEKISRDRHAFVMYEPMKREFYLKPGESSGLCYLNGELALGPVKMKAYDTILLGATKLMLVAVCCESFSWEEK